jgi:hypothetical protein
MKTLLQVVALAACVGGFQASNVSAERPMGTSNDGNGNGVGTSIGYIGVDLDDAALISLGSDGYDCQGQGHFRRAMAYALLLELGLTEYEAMVLVMTDGQGGANGQEWPVSETAPKPTKVGPLYDGPHVITFDNLK